MAGTLCEHREFAPNTQEKGDVVPICMAAVRLGWHSIVCPALSLNHQTCPIPRHETSPNDTEIREEVVDLLSSS